MSVLLFNCANAQARRPALSFGSSGRGRTRTVCSVQTSPVEDAPTSDNRSKSLFVTVPLAVCATFAIGFCWPSSAEAGILSGYKGWELELPRISVPDSAKENAEKLRQKYEQLDEDVKKTPLVQELLKRSQERAARNKKDIQDKYCGRQAEWGVGDCSLPFATPEEKEKFMETLKKRGTEGTNETTETPSTASTNEASTNGTEETTSTEVTAEATETQSTKDTTETPSTEVTMEATESTGTEGVIE